MPPTKRWSFLPHQGAIMLRSFAYSLTTLVVLAAALRADEKPALAPGNYIVYYSFGYTAPDLALCLIGVEKKGGDLKASMLEAAPKLPVELTMPSFKVDGRKIDIEFDLGGRKLTFEGNVSAKDPKLGLGSFGDDQLLSRSKLAATEKKKL